MPAADHYSERLGRLYDRLTRIEDTLKRLRHWLDQQQYDLAGVPMLTYHRPRLIPAAIDPATIERLARTRREVTNELHTQVARAWALRTYWLQQRREWEKSLTELPLASASP